MFDEATPPNKSAPVEDIFAQSEPPRPQPRTQQPTVSEAAPLAGGTVASWALMKRLLARIRH